MATNKRFPDAIRRIGQAFTRVPKSVLWAVSVAELSAILAWAAFLVLNPAEPTALPADEDIPVAATSAEPSSADCRHVRESYTVRWASMEPMIRDGAELTVENSHYRCGGYVERGDVVIYESSATKGPVVKRVRALPGDAVALKDGTLAVNGEALANSAGVPYRFSAAESLMIGIYAPHGKLQDGAYLIFGDNVSNSTDSRKYGAVRAKDFLGKVILPGRVK